jgi:site-specific recombinase XerD
MAKRLGLVATALLFPYNNSWLDGLWSRLRTAMKLSGDKQFVPYALRHTCASRLIQRGQSLRVVGDWLGHKSLSITMRYAHLSPTNLLDAVKVLTEGADTDF